MYLRIRGIAWSKVQFCEVRMSVAEEELEIEKETNRHKKAEDSFAH